MPENSGKPFQGTEKGLIATANRIRTQKLSLPYIKPGRFIKYSKHVSDTLMHAHSREFYIQGGTFFLDGNQIYYALTSAIPTV